MACAGAVVYAVVFLFGPTYTTCSSGTIGPDQPFATFGPDSCRSANFFEVNASGPEGLGQAGFAIEATSIISMGGGFVFALLCGPVLLVALIATLAMRVR